MKIVAFEAYVIYEDGTKEEVSCYLPQGIQNDLENFMDYWEESQTDEEVTE